MVKHAGASRASVGVTSGPDRLSVEVRDDGRGGADPDRGSGLTGLRDRVETAEGELVVLSPSGEGTTVRASFPVLARHAAQGSTVGP